MTQLAPFLSLCVLLVVSAVANFVLFGQLESAERRAQGWEQEARKTAVALDNLTAATKRLLDATKP